MTLSKMRIIPSSLLSTRNICAFAAGLIDASADCCCDHERATSTEEIGATSRVDQRKKITISNVPVAVAWQVWTRVDRFKDDCLTEQRIG